MPTEKKKEQVQMIADRLSRCTIAIATDYRGLTMAEMSLLRSKLREKGVEYKVVKNNLTRLAAEQAGKESLNTFLQGPTAIAFGYDDITASVKVLVEHIRSERSMLIIKGALMDNEVLPAEQVNTLSTLPSKDQLVAQTLAAMMAPLYALHYVLNAQLRGLVVVLTARLAQMKGE